MTTETMNCGVCGQPQEVTEDSLRAAEDTISPTGENPSWICVKCYWYEKEPWNTEGNKEFEIASDKVLRKLLNKLQKERDEKKEE